MRTIDQLSKEIKDEEVVHGPNSEIVGKLKSLLGLAWLDEDLDTGINLLYEASAIFHHMEQQYPETELDVDYRLANTLELRATIDEQVEEAKKIMAHVHEKRKELDADKNRAIPEQPFAAEDEELDSTLIYFDEAMVLQQSGNLTEAEALFEKCLQLRYPKFGAIAAANVNTLLSYSDLLREIGKFYKAEDILNLALKSSVVGRSRINLKTAEVLNALGNLQRVRTEFDKAEESLKEALNIRKEILTEKHIQVAATLNNIAELKRERGDNIAAVEYHLKSIQVFELVGGPSHPGTINAKGNYGITLQRLARLSDGEGFENVNNAMEYMYSNGYEDKHPWLTKFSNETILTEARRSAAANNFEFSVERYDTAIARKLASHDIHQTTRKLDELSEIDRLQLRELERERFVVLLSWCESCLVKCKFHTAADLLRKCDVFVTAHLSLGTSKREEVFWLAQFHLAQAKYARALGRYPEALDRAQKAAVLIENQREESHLFYISIQQFVAHLHIEWARYGEVRDVLNRINKLLKIRVGKDSGTFGKAPLTVTLALLRAQHVEALYGLHIGAFDLTQTKLAEMDAIIQGHTLLDHEVYGEYMLLRAKLERIRGSHEIVVRSLEQAQLSVASHYGKEHMMYVEILHESAASATLQGTYSVALNAMEEAQHLVQNMMPTDSTHPLLLWGQVTRGQVLHGVDRLREARDLFDQASQRSATIFADHPHPIAAYALEGLGSVYADLYDFKMAKEHHEAALLRWQLMFPTDTDHQYAKASCRYARCLAQVKHGRPTPAVLDAVGVAIDYVRTSTAKLRSDAASVLLADLLALKARILFEQGEWDTASQTIGEAGAQLRSYLHAFDSPKTYEMLLLNAQITSALGKHRDAKVQISFAFARLQLILGPMLPTHRKLLDVYLVAAENMRQVGYYFDAMECIDIVEEKVAKKFGVTSVEMLRISFVHALIQRDLRRLAKAEQRFMDMEERIRTVYGVASKVYFDWKFHLAKCLTMQNKQSRAMSLLQELQGDVDALLGPAPWVKTLLLNDLCYQALILKPQEQQTAMHRLKEEVLPAVTKVCGVGSLWVYHVRGRIALFMNSLKKDSGRKLLFEALKGFDELKPFNLPYDHPFVLELGGYEKPSSKDRVSKNVQEDAFYAWALLDTTAENATEFLPKSLFVDVDNNDPTIWGSVHYYGVELFNQSNVVHGGRRGRSGTRGGGGRTRSRSPSPGENGTTTTAAKPTRAKSSGQVESLVRDNESLEDALLREHKARKEVEDELVVLKHEKANLEEALDAERVETQKLQKVVEEQGKTNDALQAQVASLTADMQRVQQQLAEVQAELQRRIELEEEAIRRKQEEEEIALAEAKRREEEAAYLAEHPELIQPEDNPLYKTDLEAATFLFQRAQNLYERGWYSKAQPLFDESCTIRERILTIAKRTTMDTIRAKVLNLIAMSEFTQADAALHRIQQQEAAMHGVESEYSLQLSLDAAQSKIYQGFYPQAMEILEASAKVLNLKSQNTGEPSRIINQLFGQCLTMQGALSLQQGRINEAKALIERGQALISRALGVNNLYFVESLLVKTELLITIGKGKEAVNLLDQTIVTVKSLVKAAEEVAREKETMTSGAAKKDEVVVGGSTATATTTGGTTTTAAATAAKKTPTVEYDHPLVAQCLLLYARAAFAMSRFTEAKRRFQAARVQYVKFYEHIDSRLFPLALYEARMQLEMCDYREARVSLTSTVTVLEQAVARYEDFVPTPFALGHGYALLATLEVATGHFETARQWIKQVAMTLKALPTSIPVVEARLLDMRLSLWVGKHVEIREPIEELLEAVRNALGKEHILAVAAQMLYGDSFRLADEYDEADKYYQRALKTVRTNFVEGHPLAAICLRSLLDMYLLRQNVELSRQYLSELRTLANSLFAACLEHETFAYLAAYEAKLLLLELVLGVPAPSEAPVEVVAGAEGTDASAATGAAPATAEGVVPPADGGADAEAPAKGDEDANADADAEAASPSAEAKGDDPNGDIELPTLDAPPGGDGSGGGGGGADDASSVEGAAATHVDGDPDVEGVDKEMQLPPFNNEVYQTILEKIDLALERFEAMYSSVRLAPRSIHDDPAAVVAPLPTNKTMWMLGHPFVTYLRGLRGQVQLVEYVALQEYIRSLTAAQREHYYNLQAARQAKGKRVVPGKALNPLDTKLPDPEGKQVMSCALRYLQEDWGLSATFPLVVELDVALRDLQLQYDAMEIAHFLFQRAKALKGRGRFVDADKLFDESFGMFYQCFGPVQSAQSLIMAEILCEKAETARYLAKKVDFITSMHLLSMRMYRANHGQEITDEFVLRNLLSMTQLLMDQHLYDDALSTYRQFEATFVGVYGADVTAAVVTTAAAPATTGGGGASEVDHRSRFGLLVQIKSSIVTCLMKLHRYDEAMKVSAEALDLVKAISTATAGDTGAGAATGAGGDATWSTFTLAYLLIQIYLNDMQLMDALGNFDGSDQLYRLIETIFQSWEQQHDVTTSESLHFADYSLLKATALQLRAEHFFKVHRLHEATQCATQAYALRNVLLNRFDTSGGATVATKPTDGSTAAAAAAANGKKPTTTTVDRANKERDEEIRLNFMNAMDALVTAGLKQARENNANATATTTAAAKTTLKNGGKVTDAERDQHEEAALDEEIHAAMKDVQQSFTGDDQASSHDDTTSYGGTMTTASAPPAAGAGAGAGDVNDAANDGGNGGAGGGGSGGVAQFSVLDFIGQPERVYQWQGEKISGHSLIAESLLFEARLAMFLGQVARAKEALDVAQTMLTTLYVKPSLFKLDVQFAYAELRILQNQLEDSKKLHLQLLERRLSLVANRADHCLEVSDSLFALAKLYLLFCQYDDAMQYINDALKIERRCWSGLWKKSDGHVRIQTMMITCAGIMTGKGFYTDSQGILTATIAALKGIVGDLHLDVAAAMALKGHNACDLGHYEEALSTLQQAKSIAMVIVGDSHYFMGILHTYVSQTLRYTGKILEAKEQLDLAIVAIRSQLGKYHYLTVFTLLDIGLNFLDLGKYVTCQHVLNRALHLLKKALGKDHIAVAHCLYALGALHVAMGLVDVVNEFYEQSLYVIRKVVGSDRFPLVALIMASQCELAGMKGHYDQAVQGMDDAIALMKLIYDTGNHYFIARATIALARILLQQGKFHDAKVMFDRAFVTMKQTYPRDHPLLFEAQLGGADCLLLLGRVEQAKALFERCLNGFKDWKGSTHPSIAMVLNRMGDMLTTLTRYEAAESVLLEAWGIRMRALREVNENHPEIAENLVSLSILLRHRGTIGLTKEEVQRQADLENPKKAKARAAKKAKQQQEDGGDGGLDALLLDDALLFGDVLDDHKAAKKAKAAAKAAAAAAAGGGGGGGEGDEEGGEGGEEVVVVRGNDHDEDEDEEDDGASMPSIQISAIEKLDADQPAIAVEAARLDSVPESGDGSTIPPPATLDATALKEDAKLYAAIPLLEKAQRHLMAYYHDDEHHPSILTIHYHLAECAKMRGMFEESLAQHEAVFNLRRKVLGDQHLDTLLSLVGVLDVLRLTKRVFPPGKGAGGFFANSAPNNSDAAQLAAAKSAGQVTLVDHLASLTLPIAPSTSSKRRGTGGGGGGDDPPEEEGFIAEDATLKQLNKLKRGIASPTIAQNWRFISKMIDPSMLPPDQQPNKKKKPLPLPRGYMGYQFPAMKQNDQHQRSSTGGSLLDATATATTTEGAGAKDHVYNPLHDAKKVTDLCTQLFRKLFQPEYEALGLKKKDEHYDHPIMALILFCKAEMYRLRADGSLAMKYVEQALAMRRRLFRTHHPLIADCLVAIAELLRADQRYAQALPIYDKALEIRRETYPKEDHPCIAEVYSALALVAIGQGRYLVARSYLDQAKAICDGHLGAVHPAMALIHNNYAILQQGQGALREAMQSYRRALTIKQKVFGATHPETAATMNNMGLLLKAQGRLEAAATVFQKTLDIQRKVFGQRHPDVATTENNLAAILSQQEGQKFAAKELLKASLITRMEIYGAEHAVVASTMNNLAVLLFTLGEIGQAKEYFEEALKTRRKLLGEDHPAVGEVQHNLGYWYYAQGYLVEAKRCYEDAIRIRRKTFTAPPAEGGAAGAAAPDGAVAAGATGAGAGAPVAAEETAQQRRAKSLAVAVTALHLSGVCEQAGDLPRALEYIEEAYQIRFDLLGELHQETLLCKKSLTYIQHRIEAQQANKPRSSTGGPRTATGTTTTAATNAGGIGKAAAAAPATTAAAAAKAPPSHLGFETGLGQQSVSVGEEHQLF